MRFILFLLPFLVIIGVGSIFPIFNAEPASLPPNIILQYDRTGGPNNFNDHLSIDAQGAVYYQNSRIGQLSLDDTQTLITYLEGNVYSSLRESLYERYQRSQQKTTTNNLTINVTVRSITGIIRVIPDKFITRIVQPYVSSSF